MTDICTDRERVRLLSTTANRVYTPGKMADDCRYKIDRTAHSDQDMEERLKIDTGTDTSLLLEARQKFVNKCACSKSRMIEFLYGLFPILSWLREYKKAWIVGDLVAGLTVGVVHIPQSLAFSILAGLAPVFGLYTSFYPVILYTLMGTSRHISVGTFAVTSLMTQAVVFRHYPPDEMAANMTSNASTALTSDALSSLSEVELKRAGVAAALAFIMGIFQLLFGMLRFGFITSYLSEPVIQGFTTGAAFQVIVSQTPPALGISIQRFSGPLTFFRSWIDIFRNLPNVHVPTLVISIVCITFLTIGREINIRYKERLKMPIPTEVLIVIIAISASHFGRFKEQFDVNIVDNVPTGFPPPQLPNFSVIGGLIGDGFSIAIVGFAISVSLSKLYAMRYGYTVNPNQELIAYGTANVIPSFFLCFPSAAALARCEIQANTGGRTQVVGILSVVIVLIVVLVLGPIFEPLPRSVLASIIIVGLFGIVGQLSNLKTMFKTSKVDFAVWLMTWLAVLILGVDLGLLVGAVFAIFTVIARTQVPRFEVLANIEDTDIYKARGKFKNQKDSGGTIILKMHASLYYANKDFFKRNLIRAIGFDPSDVIAKRKEAASEVSNTNQSNNEATSLSWLRRRFKRGSISHAPNTVSLELEEPRQAENTWEPPYHTVIVDCASFGFVDYAGGKLLRQLHQSLRKLDMTFFLTNCNDDVRQQLLRSGFMENDDKDVTFISIHDAVIYSQSMKPIMDDKSQNTRL